MDYLAIFQGKYYNWIMYCNTYEKNRKQRVVLFDVFKKSLIRLIPILCLFFVVNVGFAQHDASRNAVRTLASGQIKNVFEVLEIPNHRKNSPISQAEKAYVKMLVYSQQNKLELAFASAIEAFENGFPLERFFVEPRNLLSKLHAYKPFKKFIKRKKIGIVHGPLLGSVTDRSASFWVRTAKEVKVKVVLRPTDSVTFPKQEIFVKSKTLAENDYTAALKVSGLLPNTSYDYQIYSNGKRQSKLYRFVTFPEEKGTSKFQIAFGGGAGFTEQNERMWDTMNTFDPIATLLLGDNVYIDDPEHTLTDRYCYYRRQSRPEFKQYVATNSIYAIYDDHDFGDDDCIPGPEIENPKWKRDVWNVFKNNWNNPSYGGGEDHPGCWYDFYIGNVHFILLDTRYYRDLDNQNMLGNFQKEWLLKTLKTSKGKIKVLISSVPWAPGVKPGSKDTWDGFNNGREEIFTYIEDNNIEGVVLMSADRHRTDLRKIPRPKGYDLYEMMSSRLTNIHTHDLLENSIGSKFIMGYNEECSFGLVEFNTVINEPEIVFKIINIEGKTVGEHTIKSNALTFKK